MFSLSALVTCRHPSALGTGIMHGCCSFSAAHGAWRTTSCCACAWAQASCTAAVHSRQLMELGEPPAAVRVPAWLPPDADRLPAGSPENDMNVLKGIVDRTLFNFPWENTT